MSKALLIREMLEAISRGAARGDVPLMEHLRTPSRPLPVSRYDTTRVTKVPVRPAELAKVREAGNEVVYMPVPEFKRIANPRNNGIRKPPPRRGAPTAPKPSTGTLAMLSDLGFASGNDIADNMADLGLTHMPVELSRSPNALFGHSSPHDFDVFSRKFEGKGEGHAAYGIGLYGGEHPDTMKFYRETLVSPTAETKVWFDGERVRPSGYNRSAGESTNTVLDGQRLEPIAAHWARNYGDTGRTLHELRGGGYEPSLDELREAFPNVSEAGLRVQLAMNEQAQREAFAKADLLEKYQDRLTIKPPGYTYEIALRGDPGHLMEWERPLAQQPKILDLLDDARTQLGSGPRSQALRSVLENLDTGVGGGEGLYLDLGATTGRGDRGATKALKDFGVLGHRYLDDASRGRLDLDSPDLTRNAVLYGDEAIDILDKYARGGRV